MIRRPTYTGLIPAPLREGQGPKRRAKPRDLETPVQVSIIQAIYACFHDIDVRAVPNGGKRNKTVAAQLKAAGVKKGTLDLLVAWCGRGSGGMGVIEVKLPGYTQSDITPEQRDLIQLWNHHWGLNADIASTPEEACALLDRWGAVRKGRLT